MSVTTCTHKALNAMQSKENFIAGEVQGSDAWGFNETTLVLVHAVPVRDGVEIYVIAVSNNSHDAELMRNRIREEVFNGAFNDRVRTPDRFDNDSIALGGKRPRAYPAAHWGSDTRRQSLSTFRSATKRAFQKHGLALSETSGGRIIYGTDTDSVVVAIWTQQDRGANLEILASSQNTKVAETLRNELRTEIFGAVQFD